MAHVRIEIDRGFGWQVRGEGDCEVAADELLARLPRYAIQYPHRMFLDGVLIGEVTRPNRHGKAKVVVAG